MTKDSNNPNTPRIAATVGIASLASVHSPYTDNVVNVDCNFDDEGSDTNLAACAGYSPIVSVINAAHNVIASSSAASGLSGPTVTSMIARCGSAHIAFMIVALSILMFVILVIS